MNRYIASLSSRVKVVGAALVAVLFAGYVPASFVLSGFYLPAGAGIQLGACRPGAG